MNALAASKKLVIFTEELKSLYTSSTTNFYYIKIKLKLVLLI